MRRWCNGQDQNLGAPAKCAAFPDDASYKTIGLGPCDDCGSRSCWISYLRWERKTSSSLNAHHYHLIDEPRTPPKDRPLTPCSCGLSFDDVRQSTIYPHAELL